MSGEMDVQKIKSPGTTSLTFRRFHLDEALTLRVQGALVDPRLLLLTLGGTVGGFQERFSTAGLMERSRSTLLGYNTSAIFLKEKPIVVSLFANRHEGAGTRSFGGFSEIVTENLGGTLGLRYKVLPSTFGIRREFSKESFQLGGITDLREELRAIASYDGSRNWESGGLGLRYDWTKNDDRVFQGGNYRTQTGAFSFHQGLGEYLQHAADLRVSYFDRSGSTSLSSILSDASMKFEASDTLTTSLQYLFNRTEVAGLRAMTHTGQASLEHHLFDSLVTSAILGASLQGQPDGDQKQYRGLIQTTYRKRILWDGIFAASASSSIQIEDRNLGAATVPVLAETHVVSGFAPIFLDQTDAVASTLIITDASRTITYRRGIDYDVRASGPLLEIDRLAGGIWVDGQTLVADYTRSIANALAFSIRTTRGGASVDFRWVSLSYTREVIVEDLLSGRDPGFLEDTVRDEAGVRFHLDSRPVAVQASQQFIRYDSLRLVYKAWQLNQSASWILSRRFSLHGNVGEEFFRYRVPERTTSRYAGDLELDWRPLSGLSVNPFFTFSALTDSDAPNQKMEDTGIRSRLTVGRIDVDGRIEAIERRQGQSRTDEFRVWLNAIRRF